MAVIRQYDPFGPIAVILGCVAGTVVGGVLDGVLSDRGGWFSAFGAVFGLMLGGLIGAGVWEFGRPFLRLVEALMPGRAAPPEPVAVTVVPPPPTTLPDPNRPSTVGRALQVLVAFAGVAAGMVLLVLLAKPAATLVGLPTFIVLPIGLLLVGAAAVSAWRAGAALAVYFDLTAE